MQQKTKEEREELVQLYKQSDMTVRAFAEVDTAKAAQCPENQNIRIQKNGMEIFIPVNLGIAALEKILGALKAV